MVKQRWEPMGVMSPGAPGMYEQEFFKTLGKYCDALISNVPWLNPKSAMTKVAGEAPCREVPQRPARHQRAASPSRRMLIAAEAWLAAKSTKADALIDALRKTKITSK